MLYQPAISISATGPDRCEMIEPVASHAGLLELHKKRR